MPKEAISSKRKKYARVEYRLKSERIPVYQSLVNYLLKTGHLKRPTFNALGKECLEIVANKFERFGEGLSQRIKEITPINDLSKYQQLSDQANSQIVSSHQEQDSIWHNTLDFCAAEINSLRQQLREALKEKPFLDLTDNNNNNERIVYVDERGQELAHPDTVLADHYDDSFASLQSFRDAMAGKSGFTIEVVNGTKMCVFYYPVKFRSIPLAVLFIRRTQEKTI